VNAGVPHSSYVLLAFAMLAVGLDIGVARITYGVVLPAFARDLHLSLTAAGLLGTLHLFGYLLGTLASPSVNTKVGALASPSRLAELTSGRWIFLLAAGPS
jgi:fucose permease